MTKRANKKQITTLVIAVLALIAVGAAAYVRDTRPTKSSNSATVNPKTDTAASSKDVNNNHPGQGSAAGGNNSSSTATPSPAPTTDPKYSSSTLAAPIGKPLVSNHTVSRSGTDPSNSPQEDSSCNTVPGATCYIQFTSSNGSVVKKTAAVTADENGVADIAWSAIQDPTNLAADTWTVIAVASSNGQTATSGSEKLVVNP